MLMIQAVTKKELDAIKKTGHKVTKIDRNDLGVTIDCFWNAKDGVAVEGRILVCVQSPANMVGFLESEVRQKEYQEECKMGQQLMDDRTIAADNAFASYKMPKGVEVKDDEGWCTDGSDRLCKSFYYDDIGEPQESIHIAAFIVEFKKGTPKVVESHANF